MTRQERLEEIRRATDEAIRRHAEKERANAPIRRGPAPGDLWLFPSPSSVDLRWAVVARHPEQPLLYAVPADGHPLAGLCDVVAGFQGGPLVLRCGHGLWIDEGDFRPEGRVGVLEARHSHRAAEKLHEVASGTLTGTASQKEAEADPDYEAWLDEVGHGTDALARLLRVREETVSLADVVRPVPEDAESPFALAADSASALGLPLPEAAPLPGVIVPLLHPGSLRLLREQGGVRLVWQEVPACDPPTISAVSGTGETPAGWKKMPGGWRAASFPWSDGKLLLRIGSGERVRDLLVTP